MRRTALLAIVTAISTLGPPSLLRAGDITYDIQSYASLQNGYTLSGTITTDGNTGTLTASDILAWTFAFSGPSPYTLSSTDPGTIATVIGLTATTTQLVLPFNPIQGGGPYLVLSGPSFNIPGGNDTPGLYYSQNNPLTQPLYVYQGQEVNPTGTPAWLDESFTGLDLGARHG